MTLGLKYTIVDHIPCWLTEILLHGLICMQMSHADFRVTKKDLNPSSRIVQHLHTVLIGDFGGTKICPKWTTVSGKGCAGCPRSIWTRSTYMVSHIWGGTPQFRFMLTVDTKRSIGVWLGFPIKKTVIIIFTWAYILFLSSFHAWLSCMVPQAPTLTSKSISELY